MALSSASFGALVKGHSKVLIRRKLMRPEIAEGSGGKTRKLADSISASQVVALRKPLSGSPRSRRYLSVGVDGVRLI